MTQEFSGKISLDSLSVMTNNIILNQLHHWHDSQGKDWNVHNVSKKLVQQCQSAQQSKNKCKNPINKNFSWSDPTYSPSTES